jgi:2'-5' RNA ligase
MRDPALRLFFAIPLPDGARDAVAHALAPLRAAAPDLSWDPPATLHLTLRFVGAVAEDAVEPLVAAVTACVRRVPPPPLVLAGGGAFPDADQPRALWIGVGPDGALSPLVEAMNTSLAPLGIPVEARAYVPHLTVAFVREARADRVIPALLALGEVARFVPEAVVLYQSLRGADGPVFVPMRVLPLGG